MLTFRKPTETDIQYVADHMRAADAREVKASHNSSPLGALLNSIRLSSHTSCCLVDDVPACIFGVAPFSILTGTGSPWLLGTDEIQRHRKTFVTETRQGVRDMLLLYPSLVNWVHCDNVASIIWLRGMGFQFDDPAPYGVHGELFHRFHMGRLNV